MPLVTASEAGRAQIENRLRKRAFELYSIESLSACGVGINPLKQGIMEGENPVFDLQSAAYDALSESRVGWDSSSKWEVNFF